MERTETKNLRVLSTRERILEIIHAHPGLSVSELAEHAGIYWTAAAIHAGNLSRDGLVRAVRVGRRRVLFSSENLDADAAHALAILGEPACRRVALAIVECPGRRVWELCQAIKMSERAVYHHMKRLVDAGLVETSRSGAYRGLRATPRLLACLATPADE